jgi:hypothetical protein
MMPTSEHRRTERYRQRMRAARLRPMQMWVPDTTRPGFAVRIRRQIDLLRGKAEELEALDFLEAARNENE